MIQTDNLLQTEMPFETLARVNKADWMGLFLFFAGLLFFIILLYRNPVVLRSLVIRVFKNDTEKLYFSAPAIDSVDKILLFTIYLCGSVLAVHFFLEIQFFESLHFLIYLAPIAVLIFLALPFFLVAQLLGFVKITVLVWRKQIPIFYLLGILLLPLGSLLFVDPHYQEGFKVLIYIVLSLFFLWIHVRVTRELILAGFKFYYIFLYFCTLEILPVLYFWVWLSRF